jgi:hypothetical protein
LIKFDIKYQCLHTPQTLAPALPESCNLSATSLGAQDSGRESFSEAADTTMVSSAQVQQQGVCSQPPADFWCDIDALDERDHDLQGPAYAACVAMIR